MIESREEVDTSSSGLYMEQIISKERYELMKKFFIISWNEEYLEANLVGGP